VGEGVTPPAPALFLQMLGDNVTVFLFFIYFLYLLVRPSTDYNYGHERFSLYRKKANGHN
jgi:hypothetical protein